MDIEDENYIWEHGGLMKRTPMGIPVMTRISMRERILIRTKDAVSN
jgi:hypothetical protein